MSNSTDKRLGRDSFHRSRGQGTLPDLELNADIHITKQKHYIRTLRKNIQTMNEAEGESQRRL